MRVAINGFGRIGRCVLRNCLERKIDVIGINDRANIEILSHLYQYDSTYGVKPDISYSKNNLITKDKIIPFYTECDPDKLTWNADVVFECTGVLKKRDDLEKFLSNAKKVIVSSPSDSADITVVMGVNHMNYKKEHNIISNASCTTNCLAPVVKLMDDNFGIQSGFMTTVHSYTNDQRLLDSPHKDFRRARAAGQSMIPTTTGAARAVCEVIPKLQGKIDGISIRVPTPSVSVVDFVATLNKKTTKSELNQIFEDASKEKLKGILAVEPKQLVSCDFLGRKESSIVDLSSTMVLGNSVKVLSWYDNEYGFSNRMIDLLKVFNL